MFLGLIVVEAVEVEVGEVIVEATGVASEVEEVTALTEVVGGRVSTR